MALSPYSSSWQEYQGDRSASALSSWATALIGNAATTLKKESELQSLLQQCGGSSGSSRKSSGKAAGASWGLCLILVSEKSSLPSLWKALSVAYRGKVAFGFATSGASQVLQQLGSAGDLGREKSRVISVCNGDVRTAEVYKGELLFAGLARLTFAGNRWHTQCQLLSQSLAVIATAYWHNDLRPSELADVSCQSNTVTASHMPPDLTAVAAMRCADLDLLCCFTGALKSEPLQRHINSYAAGKKCASQVVLDASTDLSSLKVAQLKALVQAQGVECAGCFEKGDYVSALKKWLEGQQSVDQDSKQEL